jgi:glyoxylase-like metal-dependent hydrolase (beta-lactamase superfamily II)
MWSRWQADRGVFFNSYLVDGADGAFAVDPLETDDPAVLRALEAAGVKTIVVTNRDHERASAAFAAALGARVIASEPDAASLVRTPDAIVRDGEVMFGWRVIVLDGYKTPGEMVLVNESTRTAISGDAFWGDPAGSLRLMPDAKLADPVRALRSARRVQECNLLHLFVGDGMPAIGTAHALLGAMLDADRRGSLASVDGA